MKTRSIHHLIVIALLCTATPLCHSTILWRGDFETLDFSQWDYLLHPVGITITQDCVSQGKAAARFTLNGDAQFLWQGRKDLNRSELQYKPPLGATFEGKDTFFRFSFYLESPLSQNEHAIGYWESHGNFQQIMRFNITGSALSFQETASASPFWIHTTGASTGRWHQVLMHIHWSTEADKGFVQTWVDGVDMKQNYFKTLNDAQASMFTQLGILRHREHSTEKILIDDAMATDNLVELMQHQREDSTTCTQQAPVIF